jgi:hypothetical protein
MRVFEKIDPAQGKQVSAAMGPTIQFYCSNRIVVVATADVLPCVTVARIS